LLGFLLGLLAIVVSEKLAQDGHSMKNHNSIHHGKKADHHHKKRHHPALSFAQPI
jgi:hypothetical protein